MELIILLTLFSVYCFSLSLTIFESLDKRPQQSYATSFHGHWFENASEPDWVIPYIPSEALRIKTILKTNKNCVNWKHEGF